MNEERFCRKCKFCLLEGGPACTHEDAPTDPVFGHFASAYRMRRFDNYCGATARWFVPSHLNDTYEAAKLALLYRVSLEYVRDHAEAAK